MKTGMQLMNPQTAFEEPCSTYHFVAISDPPADSHDTSVFVRFKIPTMASVEPRDFWMTCYEVFAQAVVRHSAVLIHPERPAPRRRRTVLFGSARSPRSVRPTSAL
jgi:hypothetical protein